MLKQEETIARLIRNAKATISFTVHCNMKIIMTSFMFRGYFEDIVDIVVRPTKRLVPHHHSLS